MHRTFNKTSGAKFIVIQVNTKLPLTNNCTQCTVGSNNACVYKVQLLSVLNNIKQNILYIH